MQTLQTDQKYLAEYVTKSLGITQLSDTIIY